MPLSLADSYLNSFGTGSRITGSLAFSLPSSLRACKKLPRLEDTPLSQRINFDADCELPRPSVFDFAFSLFPLDSS